MSKNITLAIFYFFLSVIITWWFIKEAQLLYFSYEKMFLSCAIAGAKWAIQIAAALYFFEREKMDIYQANCIDMSGRKLHIITL